MNRLPANRLLVFASLTTVVVAVDLSSKAAVFHDLGYPGGQPQVYADGTHRIFATPKAREGESIPYFDGWMSFRLLTSFNPGALWGIGQRYTWLFSVLSMGAIIGIPIWLFVLNGTQSLWLTVAMAFILGGTIGNLYDRIGMPGYADADGAPVRAVRDFLLFTFGGFHWPVFNFADVSLVTGALMLILHSLIPAHSQSSTEPSPTDESQSPVVHNTVAAATAPEPPAR
jgi:signal peptidase II